MIKQCKVCGMLKDFGSNINATTCEDCIAAGSKYCSQCKEVKPLIQFNKAGKNAAGNIRYTGECKECIKRRSAAYYVKNADTIKTQTNTYRKANLDKYVEYSNRHKERNPDKRLKQQNEASKRYSQTPHGRLLIKRHNERYNRNAKLGDLTAIQWQGILEVFEFKCAYCGSTEKLSMEHLLPVSKGGTLTAANIIVACQHCNSSRGNKDLEVWLGAIDEEHKAKIIWYMNEGHKSIE